MRKPSVSPTIRLSIGLVSMVISLVFAAEFFGFIPDQTKLALDARFNFGEPPHPGVLALDQPDEKEAVVAGGD